MGRIKHRSGASPSHGHTTPVDEHPRHGSTQAEPSSLPQPSCGHSPSGNRPQREHWTRTRSLQGFGLVLRADGLSPCQFSRREVSLCLLRLPLPTEVVHPRSRAQTLGQWPPRPPAVSHTLASCHRVSREPAGLSASRESQPQPRKHPDHTSHPLSDHCRPNHSTQGGWLQEHGELDPKSTSREQPGTPCAWEPPCKPGGSRDRQLLALPLQWPFGALVGRRRWRSLVQELCCMAAFARKCILILPLALRVISCSSHGGTRHRRSKPHRAAELTSNRNAACETSRVIFAVNKNTHPHATQRFKSCL